MNEAEFNSEIIEVCLAHFEYSSVRGTYNKSKVYATTDRIYAVVGEFCRRGI